MDKAGWVLIAATVWLVCAAVVLATLTGAIRAFRERFLPAWGAGLGAAVIIGIFDQLLHRPIGEWGGVLVIATGIVVGAVYGRRQRQRISS
jgi:hypothetical protein